MMWDKAKRVVHPTLFLVYDTLRLVPHFLNMPTQTLQHIITRPPSAYLRYGTLSLAVGLAVLVAVGWLVRYPDLVAADVFITTPEPPVQVVAPAAGTIMQLAVSEGDTVARGELLAIIGTSARLDDVQSLERTLADLIDGSERDLRNYEGDEDLQLGELQPSYLTFLTNYESLTLMTGDDSRSSALTAFDQQRIQKLRERIKRRQRSRQIRNDAYTFAKREYDRAEADKTTAGVGITKEEYFKIKERYLQEQAERDRLDGDIEEYEEEIERIRAKYSDSRSSANRSRREQIAALRGSALQMQSELKQWQREHLVYAPSGGTASFYSFRTEGQTIGLGEDVLAILPGGSSLAARAFVPTDGSGSVEVGQPVRLRLYSYPHQQFGQLQGKVSKVSILPKDDRYLIDIALPEGLVTDRGRELKFRQGLQGQAYVVVGNRRVLERVFEVLF